LHGSELAAPPTKEVGGNGHTATEAASLRSAVVDREGATNSFGGVIVPDERGYIVFPAVVAVPLAALVAYREEVSTRGMADYQHFERIHRPFASVAGSLPSSAISLACDCFKKRNCIINLSVC